MESGKLGCDRTNKYSRYAIRISQTYHMIRLHSDVIWVHCILGKNIKAPQKIQKFMDAVEKAIGEPPQWVISKNAGKYTSEVVSWMFGDTDVPHIPDIPYNSEENVIAKPFNNTVMNEVRTVLISSNMSWRYWTWELMAVVDKYNQIPHSATGKKPHEIWFVGPAPDLSNLYIFCQLGYVAVMSKLLRTMKFKNRVCLVCYLGSDNDRTITVESTDGPILRNCGTDFHPYFTTREPTLLFKGLIRHPEFENSQQQERNHERDGDDTNVAKYNEITLAGRNVSKNTAAIPKQISTTHKTRIWDCSICAIPINSELDKIDSNGKIKLLQAGEPGIIPPKTKVIIMKH